MGHPGSVVVSNGFDRVRRPYSIIGEFWTHISVGIMYGFPELELLGREKASIIEYRGYDSSEAATS